MSSLLFHDLPRGPVPLYIGEPREGVLETGTLLLDHVGREVRFVKSDPFAPFEVPQHSIHRYSWWDVDAMMPRWQLRELYGEVRPLLERIQMGTMMSRAATQWIRTQTPEAQAANALVDELTEQRAATPIDWVPNLRSSRSETAIERSIRLSSESMRLNFLHEDSRILHFMAHGKSLPEVNLGTGDAMDTLRFMSFMGAVSKETIPPMMIRNVERAIDAADTRGLGNPSHSPMRRRVKNALQVLDGNRRYSRKGLNGQWGKLIEETDVRQSSG